MEYFVMCVELSEYFRKLAFNNPKNIFLSDDDVGEHIWCLDVTSRSCFTRSMLMSTGLSLGVVLMDHAPYCTEKLSNSN